jgi:hypothetical protein
LEGREKDEENTNAGSGLGERDCLCWAEEYKVRLLFMLTFVEVEWEVDLEQGVEVEWEGVLEQGVEEGLEEGVGEEVIIYRQREEGTCYGAALGARPPRGPVLVAGKF